MADCNHDCEHCSENCSERTIQKLKANEGSTIKHVIGIVSGKGGVGKSFVTSLLASSLNKLGYKVGILDGDITGPSIPKSFNIHQNAYGDGHQYIFPAETKSGIKIISSNLLLENEEEPIIWRGTLISSLLTQFFTDVLWEELDYLLIDMPPGTGDVTLTCFQQFPLDGIIVVTSPQDLVNMVVAKAINMAKKMDIKVLGVIENMSYIECTNCHEHIELFGPSKIEEIAKKFEVSALGKLPLTIGLSQNVDAGKAELIEIKQMEEITSKIISEVTK